MAIHSDVIFHKTRQGIQEVRNRTGGLSMLQRRLLILVDGKRKAADIWKITKIADYEHMLASLERQGYISTEAPRYRKPTTSADQSADDDNELSNS